ncbi:MAG: endonuclease domain-containing protein [Sinimarinibacterium sp.]|jgi:adenine-specific DNA-methyltransferase
MPRQRSPLTPVAQRLRTTQTDAESHLWHTLRNRQLLGHKFRRQLPIGPYVADFACVERALIVELDGGQHVERSAADEVRTKALEKQGFRVLRFWNDQVLRETEAVLEAIRLALLADTPNSDPSP